MINTEEISISTISINILGNAAEAPATTATAFAEMLEAGCDSVVMEVSSQGLMLHRTAGIPFEIGIFTNLGEDHIGPNEHKDFDDYI